MPSPEDLARQAVVLEAQAWLGTPYHHQARVKGPQGGVDCGLLLAEVFAPPGLIPPVPELAYSRQWHLHRDEPLYLDWVKRYAREIPGPPRPGDITMYRFGRQFSHGAVVICWPTIIHAVRDLQVMWGHGEQMVINGKRPTARKFYRLLAWGD